jgi:hypothetical protein
MPPSVGLRVSLPERPLIWIDNSLSPLVAKALQAVGYHAVVQTDIPEFRDLPRVLDDAHIIPWVGAHEGVWVHKDNDARTRHARQMITEDIRTIWVAEPRGADFSSAGQLRLISYALPAVLRDWRSQEPCLETLRGTASRRLDPNIRVPPVRRLSKWRDSVVHSRVHSFGGILPSSICPGKNGSVAGHSTTT